VPEVTVRPLLDLSRTIRHPVRPLWKRYGFALFSVLIAFFLTPLLQPYTDFAPYSFFWGAVAFSAWYGGFRPALVAILLSIGLIEFFLMPTSQSAVIASSTVLGYLIFLVIAAIVSGLYESNRRTEKALIDQNEWFRVTLTGINDGVIATDVNGAIVFINGAAEQITGWKQAESVGKDVYSIFNMQEDFTYLPIDPRDTTTMQKVAVKDKDGYTRLLTREGDVRTVIDSCSVIRDAEGKKIGVVFVFRDVSEQRRVDNALRESEQRFRMLAEHAQDMVSRYRLSPKRGYDYVSPASANITGYTPEEYYSDPDIDVRITYPDDLPYLNWTIAHLETAQQPIIHRMIHKNGSVIWVEYRYTLMYDEQGRLEAVESISRDITRRKEAEERAKQLQEEAQQARERLQITLASIADAVIATDAVGNVTFLNRVAMQLTGSLPEESQGKSLGEILTLIEEETGEPVKNPHTLGSQMLLIERDGQQIPAEYSSAPIRDEAGDITGSVLVFRDITERRDQERVLKTTYERTHDLYQISRRLGAARSLDDVMHSLAASSYLSGIDQISIIVFDNAWEARIPTEYEVISALKPELPFRGKHGERLRLQTHPLFKLMSRTKPIFIQDTHHDPRFEPDEAQRLLETGYRTIISMPLEANGKWYGMLNIYAKVQQRWTPEEMTHVDGLVDQVAVAVDNMRLLESEARARERLQHANERLFTLQQMIASLSQAVTVEQVARVVTEQSKTVLGADVTSVYLLSEDGQWLDLLYTDAHAQKEFDRRFSVDTSIPMSDAVRTGHAVWLGKSQLIDTHYQTPQFDFTRKAWCALPLQIDEQTIGGIGFSYAEEHEFGAEEQVFLLTISQHCAQALERARLYDAEREANAEARVNAGRLQFLARASEILSSSLDYETTLQSVLRLTLPDICDWCVVHLVGDDRQLRQLVLTADPLKAALGRELEERYAIFTNDEAGMPTAMRTGKSILYEQITDEMLVRAAIDERHLEIQRELGIASSMIIPLFARNNRLGMLTMVSSDPKRLYNRDDLSLAEDLGRRIGMAIDNARLYRQAQISAAMEERQRLARELHDAVTQTLFTASVLSESLPRLWQRDREKVFPNLEKLVRLTRGALAEMRVLLLELRPTMIVNTNLGDLLVQLSNAIQGQRSFEIECDVEDTGGLPEDVHIAFYRITQESLNNIIKHAHATQVKLYLRSRAKQVVLEVSDNGRGFDLATDTPGFGLNNIHERAEAIGANLTIEGGEGKGTKIRVEWDAAE
jgi:PAS domain S-box-containing protein